MSGRRLAAAALPLLAVATVACSGSDGSSSDPATTSTTSTTAPVETGSLELGPEARPASLVAPTAVDAPAPLIVLLHGFSADAQREDRYLGVTAAAASRGAYVLLPEGTQGPAGRRFWDATAACCNFTGTPVDDVGYLMGLIDEAIAARPIDADRVYLLGHSNGGFMSYRLACEHPDRIAAVAVLAGTESPDAGACRPSAAVSVLHLHGTEDKVIAFGGGATIASSPATTYAGALDTVSRWAERDGCDGEPIEAGGLDVVATLAGAETTVHRYEGCDDDVDVQLDTLVGAGHVPMFTPSAIGDDVLDWLLDHER